MIYWSFESVSCDSKTGYFVCQCLFTHSQQFTTNLYTFAYWNFFYQHFKAGWKVLVILWIMRWRSYVEILHLPHINTNQQNGEWREVASKDLSILYQMQRREMNTYDHFVHSILSKINTKLLCDSFGFDWCVTWNLIHVLEKHESKSNLKYFRWKTDGKETTFNLNFFSHSDAIILFYWKVYKCETIFHLLYV